MLKRLSTSSAENITDSSLREQVYQGTICHFDRTTASQQLVARVLSLLEAEFGQYASIRQAQFHLTNDQFFAAIGRLRKILFHDPIYIQLVKDILAEFGFSASENAFEPMRLRAIMHNGHNNPLAAPIYYAHRDTWYAHPQSLIAWWIPLHDLSEIETFVFYPDYFQRAVKNGSGDFDYDQWVADKRQLRVGWQDANAGKEASYPALQAEISSQAPINFSAKQGEIIIFSGAHLHQTLNNSSGQTRFSIDFRTVNLYDLRAGLGAPNVDNRSRGSAISQYINF